METTQLIENYPKIDGHRKHFVKHPVQTEDGKWYGAKVFIPEEGGNMGSYSKWLPGDNLFDNEEECQQACDIHNKWCGWDDEEIEFIISKSMGLL